MYLFAIHSHHKKIVVIIDGLCVNKTYLCSASNKSYIYLRIVVPSTIYSLQSTVLAYCIFYREKKRTWCSLESGFASNIVWTLAKWMRPNHPDSNIEVIQFGIDFILFFSTHTHTHRLMVEWIEFVIVPHQFLLVMLCTTDWFIL